MVQLHFGCLAQQFLAEAQSSCCSSYIFYLLKLEQVPRLALIYHLEHRPFNGLCTFMQMLSDLFSVHLQSGIRYPVVVRFSTVNYAGVSTNNYGLEEVEQL